MIQRIQTVYLFISSILLLVFNLVNIGYLRVSETLPKICQTTLGFETVEGQIIQVNWPLFIISIVVTLLPFITIFLYRKRVLQIRITTFTMLLTIAVLILALVSVYIRNENSFLGYKPSFWLSFPVISLIFDYIAIRNIAIDDRLVKSLDRLR